MMIYQKNDDIPKNPLGIVQEIEIRSYDQRVYAHNRTRLKYDWVGKVIHWELCKGLKFDHTTKGYMHTTEQDWNTTGWERWSTVNCARDWNSIIRPKGICTQQNKTEIRLGGKGDPLGIVQGIEIRSYDQRVYAHNRTRLKYDWVGKVIHWELCKGLKFDHTTKGYMHTTEQDWNTTGWERWSTGNCARDWNSIIRPKGICTQQNKTGIQLGGKGDPLGIVQGIEIRSYYQIVYAPNRTRLEYNWVGKVIHWELCKGLKFDHTTKLYMHTTEQDWNTTGWEWWSTGNCARDWNSIILPNCICTQQNKTGIQLGGKGDPLGIVQGIEIRSYYQIVCAHNRTRLEYNWVGKVIHWELCKGLKFDHTTKLYMHRSEYVIEIICVSFSEILRYKRISQFQPNRLT